MSKARPGGTFPDHWVLTAVPVALGTEAVLCGLRDLVPSEFSLASWTSRGILPPIMLDAVGWVTFVGCVALASVTLTRGRRLGRISHVAVIGGSSCFLMTIGWNFHSWAAAHRTSLPDDLLGHLAVPLVTAVPMTCITVVCGFTRAFTLRPRSATDTDEA